MSKYVFLVFILSLSLSFSSSGKQQSASSDKSLLETINLFYKHLSERNCTEAVLIRKGYSIKQCNTVSDININSLRIEFNNNKTAVAYINLEYSRNGRKQFFVGYFSLIKANGQWVIENNFSSIDKVTLREFISRESIGNISFMQGKNNRFSDRIDGNHNSVLNMLEIKYSHINTNNFILVDISEQRLYLYSNRKTLIKAYAISSSVKGIGNQKGSDKTPLGAHVIKNKYGHNAKLGTIFQARIDTGKIAKILTNPIDVEEDYITTRILWLDGLEKGKNKGGNVDSYSRYIYIHGTPEEGLIGSPASHGCIRMHNKDVVELFNSSDENTIVYIGE